MAPDPGLVAVHQLAVGLRVVRRGRDHLQVGAYAGRRLVLPRTPVVERVLGLLTERGPLNATTDPEAAQVLHRLVEAGCAVPVAAVHDRHGRRLRTRVGLLGSAAGSVDGVDVVALLTRAGLHRVDLLEQPADSDVVLVVAHGEPDRALLDPLVRREVPHLLLRLVDGRAVLGPFVLPGSTPCLRCLDAAQSVPDPHHVAVTARYVGATSRPRPDGALDVCEPALSSLALAWAVRDVVAHVEGREPSTWGRTLELGPEPADLARAAWQRHPDCGCSWPSHAVSSGKMES